MKDQATSMESNGTGFNDLDKSESLSPINNCKSLNKAKSPNWKHESTQTSVITTDLFSKTYSPIHENTRLKTSFPELMNSSEFLKKFEIAPNSTMAIKQFDVSQNNSCLMTADRNSSSKDRPASVINKPKNNFEFIKKSSSNDSIKRHEGRYTPIGKLEILCEDNKRNKGSK